MVIYPLLKYNIKNIYITTFQSCSGSGYKGIKQLENELKNIKLKKYFYEKKILNDIIPYIGNIDENNYCDEENKLCQELPKILNLKKINIYPTCIRCPIKYCHTLSVNIEFNNKIYKQNIEKSLIKFNGLCLSNNFNISPSYCKNKLNVYITRLRIINNTCSLIIIFDNLMRGASLNSIEIAEIIYNRLYKNI